jgi:hypothetical protein
MRARVKDNSAEWLMALFEYLESSQFKENPDKYRGMEETMNV